MRSIRKPTSRTFSISSSTFGPPQNSTMLNRKNALFAGHDEGAESWACIASLIETCKLNGVPWTWAAERPVNKFAA